MSAPSSGRIAHCAGLAACACLLVLAFDANMRASASGGEAAAMAESRVWRFDIPPQNLKSALRRWSEITGIDWAHVGPDFADVKTRGVTGTATAAEALRQLLSETGYAYAILPSGSVSIVRAQGGSGASGGHQAA